LNADYCFDLVGAERLQRQSKHERLRNRLEGESDGSVADLVDVTVDRGETHAEVARVGLAQFRDVIGNRAAIVASKFGMAIGEKALQGRKRVVRRRPAAVRGAV